MEKAIKMQYGILLAFTVFMLFSLLPSANALTCYYNEYPYYNILENKISWICQNPTDTKCMAYILSYDPLNGSNTNTLLYSFPDITYLDDYGEVSYFECKKSCPIEFKTDFLFSNTTYKFVVACENSLVSVNITPRYYLKSDQITSRLMWFEWNSTNLFLALLIILICLLIVKLFIYFIFKS